MIKKDIEFIEKRIEQKGAASFLSVNPRTLRRYKEGTRRPRKDILNKIKILKKEVKKYKPTRKREVKKKRLEEIIKFKIEEKFFEKSGRHHFRIKDLAIEDLVKALKMLEELEVDGGYLDVKGIKAGENVVRRSELWEFSSFVDVYFEQCRRLIEEYELKDIKIDIVGVKF